MSAGTVLSLKPHLLGFGSGKIILTIRVEDVDNLEPSSMMLRRISLFLIPYVRGYVTRALGLVPLFHSLRAS